MIIIPAVDLKDGNCVRLLQGDENRETVYSDDPVAMAKEWEHQGAERLHVVDLNGAFSGCMQNREIIIRIINELGIPVEVGGGIRDHETVENLIKAGVFRVILGTAAINDMALLKKVVGKWPEKIAVGIDSVDGKVAVKGWRDITGKESAQLAVDMEKAGVKEIIVTDISTDGMLSGPNTAVITEIAQKVDISVIASGGIASISDIIELKKLGLKNLTGVIVGKALYTGDVILPEALEALKGETYGS
ncbi:MAG: 1-(5-phosphoribosyl)-5-[(5-phosphoribosylamino)methylideneamino]imidazole-4-carboxamide isomerase [Elusimicrobiota bacterium]